MTVIRGSLHLGTYEDQISKAFAKLTAERVVDRIFSRDYSVWKPAPHEIANRLGWLRCSQTTLDQKDRIQAFADDIRGEGFTRILLLGMGGSSLAPEVFQTVFGRREGYPFLSILDSTDPQVIFDHDVTVNSEKTLFIVSTKSGTTIETLSLFKHFYSLSVKRFGLRGAGSQFIAITDPGSTLAEIARQYQFRETFLNDPDIGGRYSALSLVGMVPAALVGIDFLTLLERAESTAEAEQSAGESFNASRLGVTLSELAKDGRDKATFVFSPGLSSFGDWIEQLIAESTGKEKMGILPVMGEPITAPGNYGRDRLFIAIRWRGDTTFEKELLALEAASHPVIRVTIDEPYDLGGHCFFWELATAVAGHGLEINPFDQPDVEAAKVQTRKILAKRGEQRSWPDERPFLTNGDAAFYGDITAGDPEDALAAFLEQGEAGDYVGLLVFLSPSSAVDEALTEMRVRIRDRFHLVTTCGYGPRYLHSTGQLHKGDSGRGLFIVFTADSVSDIPIPDTTDSPEASIGFDVLKKAQALGDLQALRKAGRRVLRIHLHGDAVRSLTSIGRSL
jgi:glucose-6-phosphate isomerase